VSSLERHAAQKLSDLEAKHLKRTLAETTRENGVTVVRGGRRYLSFSCNDYLNLSHHQAVKAAAILAIKTYGTGSGASRLITGNHPLLVRLEEQLAQFKGTNAACVFGSGYLANSGIIPAFVGPDDLIVVDELAHSCLWAGSILSRANVVSFRHNDASHAAELLAGLRASHRHALLVTETVFSMDGDTAPVEALAALAKEFDAWLMTDDAHGAGVTGRSAVHGELQMGTLSKALGSYGGYVCAAKSVIDFVKTRARTLIYSTGLPPASAAAASAALAVIEANPELTHMPLAKARRFTRAVDIPPAQSPIVPIVVGEAQAALSAQRILEDEGFLVVAIRPPTVPAGTSRLRLAFTAGHSDADIDRLAEIVRCRILPTVSSHRQADGS
jgi:8-amino-7-oxononanoate synthase